MGFVSGTVDMSWRVSRPTAVGSLLLGYGEWGYATGGCRCVAGTPCDIYTFLPLFDRPTVDLAINGCGPTGDSCEAEGPEPNDSGEADIVEIGPEKYFGPRSSIGPHPIASHRHHLFPPKSPPSRPKARSFKDLRRPLGEREREREREERIMSGWDEGAVFYSDQAQFPRGGGDPDQGSITRHTALRKFKEFIRGFNGEKGDFPYRLVHSPDHLTVAMEDIDAFDAVLSDKIRKFPADFLPLFETAASEVLASLRSKVAGETGEMEEPITGEVQVFLSSKESSVSMRSIGVGFVLIVSNPHLPS
ncbi:hypothetical protein GW17_00039483 [Ensete ventricosum]|nr:hypothetical protein GW17_00039483 [Ensete ventricosum]